MVKAPNLEARKLDAGFSSVNVTTCSHTQRKNSLTLLGAQFSHLESKMFGLPNL